MVRKALQSNISKGRRIIPVEAAEFEWEHRYVLGFFEGRPRPQIATVA
jgi:hypothetical protein